jgi:hypothetical protein
MGFTLDLRDLLGFFVILMGFTWDLHGIYMGFNGF